MARIFSISVLVLGQVVFGSPAEMQRRAVCNQDNCLRQLQHSSALASPFCSSYLNVVTATKTITITTTSTTAISAFTDTSITEFAKRSTAPAFSPSSCTEAPNAISSGCSCLLTSLPTIIATATATATVTSTSALPTQCNAAHNYGIVTDGFGLEDGPGQANHYFEYNESIRGACCARCFETTNCLAFAEFGGGEGVPIECLIWEIYVSPTNVQNSLCPLGTVTVSLTNPTSTGSGGVGPCGVAG